MRFDLHHPANRRRPHVVIKAGRGDDVVAGVAVHPEERLFLLQHRNELALALLVSGVILDRAGVSPLVLLRCSPDSQALRKGCFPVDTYLIAWELFDLVHYLTGTVMFMYTSHRLRISTYLLYNFEVRSRHG